MAAAVMDTTGYNFQVTSMMGKGDVKPLPLEYLETDPDMRSMFLLIKKHEQHYQKIVLGCFNLGVMVAIWHYQEVKPVADEKTLNAHAEELRAVVVANSMFGDQNYGAELFSDGNSKTSTISLGRKQNTIRTWTAPPKPPSTQTC